MILTKKCDISCNEETTSYLINQFRVQVLFFFLMYLLISRNILNYFQKLQLLYFYLIMAISTKKKNLNSIIIKGAVFVILYYES